MFENTVGKPEPENSLMVVTTREEYCFLWDPDCLPELVESLLGYGEPPEGGFPHPMASPVESLADRPLTIDHFRTVVRELLTKHYLEL